MPRYEMRYATQHTHEIVAVDVKQAATYAKQVLASRGSDAVLLSVIEKEKEKPEPADLGPPGG